MCDSKRFEDMDFLLIEELDDIASFVDISTSKALPPEDQINSSGTHSKGIILTESDQLMEQVHGDQVIDSIPYDNDAWQKDGTMTPFLKTDSIKNKLHSAILSRCRAEGKKLTLDQRRANKVEDKLRPDEEEKKQARKERNKLSAKKSRDSKKAFYDDIKKAHKRLMDENKRMKETNKWLKMQSSKLEKIVMDHDLVCKVAEGDELYKPKYQVDFGDACFKTKYSVQEGRDSMCDDNCLNQCSDDELHEVVDQSLAFLTDIYEKKVLYADSELAQTDTALDCDLETNLTLRDISDMNTLDDQNNSMLSEDAREMSTSHALCADYIDYLDNPVPLDPAVCPHDISINLDGPDISNTRTTKQILPALPHTVVEHAPQLISLSQTDANGSFQFNWDPVLSIRQRSSFTPISFGTKSLSTTSSNAEVQSFPPTSSTAEVKLHSQSRFDTLTKPPPVDDPVVMFGPRTPIKSAPVYDPVIVFRPRTPIKSVSVDDPVIVFRPRTPIKPTSGISAWSVGDSQSSEDIEELTSIFKSLDYGPPPEKKSKF